MKKYARRGPMALAFAMMAACGSRTSLLIGEPLDASLPNEPLADADVEGASDAPADGVTPPRDANAPDALLDGAIDASADSADSRTDAAACPTGKTSCGNACVDEQTDPSNCGACGNVCPPGCDAGGCISVTAITAGALFTCALLSDRTVDCWGDNEYGQLGNGTTTDALAPTRVASLRDAVRVTAGDYHACAIVSDGTVRCWGSNETGQLGNGMTSAPSSTPVSVAGLTGAVALALGDEHSCALRSDGTVWCWGVNNAGQLGRSDAGTGANGGEIFPTAAACDGVRGVMALVAGANHTCAVQSGRTAECWGWNDHGQLGAGTFTDSPAPVGVVGLTDVAALSSGQEYTCALLSDGGATCWGQNYWGNLGDGTTVDSRMPVLVSGLGAATSIAAGGYGHACAMQSNGGVACWGYNAEGELGDGTTIRSSRPVAVSGLHDAVALAAGFQHTCALLSDRSVACWGLNLRGELGNGAVNDAGVSTPVKVVW